MASAQGPDPTPRSPHNVIMPLTLADLLELRSGAFADDVDIDAARMASWSVDEATAYFESGGTEEPLEAAPHPTTAPVEPAAPVAYALLWSLSGPLERAVASVQHPAAHSDKISSVRLRRQPDGTVVAATAGMDCSVRAWHLTRGTRAPTLLSVMGSMQEGTGWGYDAVCLGPIDADGTVGIASGHTGGMTGEPPNVIKLWSTNCCPPPAGSHEPARGELVCLPQEALHDPTASGGGLECWVHRRGVHSVEFVESSRTLITISPDGIGCWRCATDGPARPLTSFHLVARGACPVDGAPVTCAVLHDHRTLAVVGQTGGVGLPLLDLNQELAVSRLGGCSATDYTDVAQADAHVLAASTLSRVWLWDLRDGAKPCARLERRGTRALAALCDASAAPWLFVSDGASESGVLVYDVRKLPEDKKTKPPPPIAQLSLAASPSQHDGITSLAANGTNVAGADATGGLHAWDVGAPLDREVVEAVSTRGSGLEGLADLAVCAAQLGSPRE